MFAGRTPLSGEDVYHATNLADALSALRNSQTRWLVANGKGFGDEEAIRIARALTHNKHLQELSLAGNRIGPEGAEALGHAVGAHPFLKEFYLQKNRLGQEGIERFAAAVQSGGAPRLEVINTSSNGIGPHFPPGLALPTLKSLIVKNNNIKEIPACYGECDKLSNVVLDNNPLISPPMDVYVSNGWMAIKSFLVTALEREKEQNRSAGIGSVSNHKRDETLLGPVRKLINRGALRDAALALEKARGIYVRLDAKQEITVVDLLARQILSLLAMENGSFFPVHLDSCFRAEGNTQSSDDGFLMSRHLVAEKAPFLSSFLCDNGFDVAVSVRGQNAQRKIVDVPETSRGGLRCFLAYLLLDDLKQAVSICAKLENMTHDDDGFSSDDDESDEDSSDSSDSSTSPNSSPMIRNQKGAPFSGYIKAQGGCEERSSTPMGDGQEEMTATAQAGGGQVETGVVEESANLDEGLSPDLGMLLDAAELGKRFAVDGIERQAEKVLYQRLQPWNVMGALKAAHRRGNEELKRVCMGYLDEHGAAVGEEEWRALGAHCDLMMQVMDSLSRSDGRPPSARWMVSSVLMRHVLERLERAERKADKAQELRERTEQQLRKLQSLLAHGGDGARVDQHMDQSA